MAGEKKKRGILLSVKAMIAFGLLLFSMFGLIIYNLYRVVDSSCPEINLFQTGSFLWACIFAVFGAVFFSVSFYHVAKYSFNAEAEENATRLSEGARSLENQSFVVNCFSSIFYYAAVVNVKQNSFYAVLPCDFVSDVIGERGTFTVATKLLIKENVDSAYQNMLDKRLDPDNLDETFKEGDAVFCEYVSNYVGWSRLVAIAAERDENNKPTKILLALMQIDEQKRRDIQIQDALKAALDAADAANRAKSDFLSKMSHDLRTPMNGILGMTALAATRLDDKERVKYCLDKINDAGKHLVSIVDEVLDMSRIESGRVELNEEGFSLSDLMDSLITIIHPQTDKKGQDLRVNVSKVNHEKVIGDPTRLQEVFANLCSNAIKYTPNNGMITISLTELYSKNESAFYQFCVEDNGIGMSKEYQQHLFEPFTRESSERTKAIQGTGLGLPIAKNIINMMGGDLVAESEVDKGSTFTATFLLKLQETGSTELPEVFGKHILIVDDNVRACDLNKELLEDMGAVVEGAYGGKEGEKLAIERHKEGNPFDLAIIDWKMPEYDGMKVVKGLKKELGDRCPVLAIAAYDWGDIEVAGYRAGVKTFIAKPFFKSRLIDTLRFMLGNEEKQVEDNPCDKLMKNDFTGKRALLVEDNELNMEIATELLKMTGLTVECATDGAMAVNMASEKAEGYYDIILMDIQMPIMNGHEAAKAIRMLPRANAKKIPIIAMSANAFMNDIQESRMSGMNEHISKPIDINRLNQVLSEWIG